MLSRSVVTRYLLVATVSAFVAIATAATAVTAHNDGFSERIVNCIETRHANSDQCIAALEVSPVDPKFLRGLADNLDNMPAKEEPKPEVDVYALVKQCAATGNLESDECALALEQNGLSLEEFKAKLAAKLNGNSPDELSGLVEKVNYTCGKALVESHMDTARFWTKYR
jgi:hypothetical protein